MGIVAEEDLCCLSWQCTDNEILTLYYRFSEKGGRGAYRTKIGI
jgi:hypothetical protein